jgi:hypothetical protein
MPDFTDCTYVPTNVAAIDVPLAPPPPAPACDTPSEDCYGSDDEYRETRAYYTENVWYHQEDSMLFERLDLSDPESYDADPYWDSYDEDDFWGVEPTQGFVDFPMVATNLDWTTFEDTLSPTQRAG